MRKGLWRACFSFHRHIWRHDNFATSPRKTKNDGDSQKNDRLFPKNDGLFPKKLPRFSDFVGENWRNKGEKRKIKRKKEYTKRHQRQKQKESTAETKGINGRNRRNQRQKQKGFHGRNKKDSTAKTKRNPHKIGRKEGQFVPKNKDLRSKILMQTLHFRPKNLVKRIIYCNFVHYKWGFLTTAAIQKFSLL